LFSLGVIHWLRNEVNWGNTARYYTDIYLILMNSDETICLAIAVEDDFGLPGANCAFYVRNKIRKVSCKGVCMTSTWLLELLFVWKTHLCVLIETITTTSLHVSRRLIMTNNLTSKIVYPSVKKHVRSHAVYHAIPFPTASHTSKRCMSVGKHSCLKL